MECPRFSRRSKSWGCCFNLAQLHLSRWKLTIREKWGTAIDIFNLPCICFLLQNNIHSINLDQQLFHSYVCSRECLSVISYGYSYNGIFSWLLAVSVINKHNPLRRRYIIFHRPGAPSWLLLAAVRLFRVQGSDYYLISVPVSCLDIGVFSWSKGAPFPGWTWGPQDSSTGDFRATQPGLTSTFHSYLFQTYLAMDPTMIQIYRAFPRRHSHQGHIYRESNMAYA